MKANYRKHNDGSQNSSTYHKKDGTPVRAKLKGETRGEVTEASRRKLPMPTANPYDLSFKRVDEGYYDVFCCGVRIGCVYQNPEAWSYASWFVEGDRVELAPCSSATGKKLKPHGQKHRMDAANRLAVMQSGAVLAGLKAA